MCAWKGRGTPHTWSGSSCFDGFLLSSPHLKRCAVRNSKDYRGESEIAGTKSSAGELGDVPIARRLILRAAAGYRSNNTGERFPTVTLSNPWLDSSPDSSGATSTSTSSRSRMASWYSVRLSRRKCRYSPVRAWLPPRCRASAPALTPPSYRWPHPDADALSEAYSGHPVSGSLFPHVRVLVHILSAERVKRESPGFQLLEPPATIVPTIQRLIRLKGQPSVHLNYSRPYIAPDLAESAAGDAGLDL